MVLLCDKYLPYKCQDFSKKKIIKKKITDIEEDCSVYDE